MKRALFRSLSAGVSLVLTSSLLPVGEMAVALPAPDGSRKQVQTTAFAVDASVTIDRDKVELDGPVTDFSVSLPRSADGATLAASLTDDGVTAVLNFDFAEPTIAEVMARAPENVETELVKNDDGAQSVVMTDPTGEFVGGLVFDKASTQDGEPVEVELTIDGSKVIPTFHRNNRTVTEPVSVSAMASTVWYKRGWITKKKGKKYIVNVEPTKLGRWQNSWNVYKIHVKHAKKVLGARNTKKYWNWNIEQQFICHVAGAWFPSGVYNMESWQPALAWWKIANPVDRCNRSKK